MAVRGGAEHNNYYTIMYIYWVIFP